MEQLEDLKCRNKDYLSIPIHKMKFRQSSYAVSLRKLKRKEEAEKRRYKKALILSPLIPLHSLEIKLDLDDEQTLQNSLKSIHSMLIERTKSSFERILSSDTLNRIIALCDPSSSLKTIHYSSLIIIDFASSNSNIDDLVENKAIENLLSVIQAFPLKDCRVSLWALAKLVDNDLCCIRDYMLHLKALDIVLSKVDLNSTPDLEIQKLLSWFLAGISKSEKAIEPEECDLIIEIASFHNSDLECYLNYLKVAGNLCSNGMLASIVIDKGALDHAVQHLIEGNQEFFHSSLNIIGNICSGNHSNTEAFAGTYDLSCLIPALLHVSNSVREKGIWILFNISAGTALQIKRLVNNEVFEIGIDLLFDPSSSIQKKALDMVRNISRISYEDHTTMVKLATYFPMFISLIETKENIEVLDSLLELCSDILNAVSWDESVFCQIAECFKALACIERIEILEDHPNTSISEKASLLLNIIN